MDKISIMRRMLTYFQLLCWTQDVVLSVYSSLGVVRIAHILYTLLIFPSDGIEDVDPDNTTWSHTNRTVPYFDMYIMFSRCRTFNNERWVSDYCKVGTMAKSHEMKYTLLLRLSFWFYSPDIGISDIDHIFLFFFPHCRSGSWRGLLSLPPTVM